MLGLGTTSNDFRLWGSWKVFTANEGPYQGQQVYFDDSGNEFVNGTGPQLVMQSGGTGSFLGFNQSPGFQAQEVPVATTPVQVNPVIDNSITPMVNNFTGVLTQASFFGIPNWILGVGILGLLFGFDGKGKRK